MTYEEAIRIINSDLANYEELTEARAIVTKAAEKQIPKKPVAMADHMQGCPSCQNYLARDYEKGYPHCMMCGQAIDWSFEKEDEK